MYTGARSSARRYKKLASTRTPAIAARTSMREHYVRIGAADSTQYRWLIAAVMLVTAALYAYAVGSAPEYLGGDEARFATAASAIASTGRDLIGDRLPLFFHLP